MPSCPVCRGTRQAFPLSYDVHAKMLVAIHADNSCPACTEDGPLNLDESWKQLTTFFIHPDDELKTMILVGFLAVLEAVEATEGEGYKHGMDRWECDFEAVRRRILGLGNLASRPGPVQQGELL